MSRSTPKGHISLGEAVSRLGQCLFPSDWTGEEFASAVSTMATINRDTQDYFIGWVASHRIDIEDTSTPPKRRTKENPDDGQPLSDSGKKRWKRASEIYEEARSLIDEMTQIESIKDGRGHLAKIWNDRGIVFEWPEDFPLSKDELESLKIEEEEFRAPREAAYKRLDEAARLLQQELCGTPPDCEDAIPALWHYPDKTPDRIDLTSWVGSAGLNNLKRAARDDYSAPGRSRIVVPLEGIESLCLSVKPPVDETKGLDNAAGAPKERLDIQAAVAASPLAKADQAQTDDDLKDWFVDIYVPAHKDDSPNPTRDAALSAAKPKFANYLDLTHLRDDLRNIWRTHAPEEWKRTGPRAKTE